MYSREREKPDNENNKVLKKSRQKVWLYARNCIILQPHLHKYTNDED